MFLDVGTPLAAIDRDTRAGDEARLARAEERDDGRHLVRRPEATERHLLAHEVCDAVGVGLLTAVPTPALPQDRAWRHRVYGHAAGHHLSCERLDEADLAHLHRGQGG